MLSWLFLKYKILVLKTWKVALETFRSGGKLSKYPRFVIAFEQNFAKYIGCKFGMSFCNGSSAIEAALFALGIGPGDEVLVSSCSIHSIAVSIISLGAQPVFVDIDPQSLNFDPEEIDKKVSDKTRCLIVVHLWGNPANMAAIKDKAQKFQLKIIEDCSHAHGATLDGRKVGSFGDIGCFSLQGYKAISAMEGGIVVTNEAEYYHRLTLYGHFGRNPAEVEKTIYRELLPTGIATKRRANPLGICLAAIDLKFIDKKNKHKRRLIQKVERLILGMEEIESIAVLPTAQKGGFFPSHLILIKEGYDKETGLKKLRERLKSPLFIGYPKAFKVPDPHFHQIKHLYDLKYRTQLISGSLGSVTLEASKLPHTESVMERVIFIPIG